MNLQSYRTLGRSGLVVSPLGLGTMTFGAEGWGSSSEVSQTIFDAYVEAGGNFIDTADVYTDGLSEELVGRFITERNLRDEIVLATKFTFNDSESNPNAGGNGRKNAHRALDASLRRLKTDYVDLYYTHVWDTVTPVEEVLQTLGDFVRAGKIRYFALSDLPAWYAARAVTLASAHAIPGPIAMQLEYSLVNRGIEREHVDAARTCGLGIVPWGPLASGFLSGKYTRTGDGLAGAGRFATKASFREFPDRSWGALDALRAVAAELERPLAPVALAWTVAKPGIAATLIGASSLAQLHDNLVSLEIVLTPGQMRRLDEASALDRLDDFSSDVKRAIFGGHDVRAMP